MVRTTEEETHNLVKARLFLSLQLSMAQIARTAKNENKKYPKNTKKPASQPEAAFMNAATRKLRPWSTGAMPV
jgi:hypothetical protein